MMGGSKDIGIHGLEIYIPKQYVCQQKLEEFDKVSSGKYTVGLGQLKMAVVDDREDINSICLSVVSSLLQKYNIDPKDVGRLEVGTETIIDKSKSVKSVLMQLFGENTSIEGVDTTNACYGGTNALFNCLNWLSSDYYDGRYAICVAADIAVYKNGGARPTGGAGAVAILLGRDAPIVFDPFRSTHCEHVYDFYKPDLHSEYPEVDGPLSNRCYTNAVDKCYNRYLDMLATKGGVVDPSMDYFDFILFHSPYSKLVQKSFGRVRYNDFKRNPNRFPEMGQFQDVGHEESITDRVLEKAFMGLSKDDFGKKVTPAMVANKNLGNMYCASLYGALCALVSSIDSNELQQKRVLLFSYGSGLASSMFSVLIRGDTTAMAAAIDLENRLQSRTEIPPQKYDDIMNLREQVHNAKDYIPKSNLDSIFAGSYYLERIDQKFRRTYQIKQ